MMTSAFRSDIQVGHVSLFDDIFSSTCRKYKILKKVTFTKPFLLAFSDPTPDLASWRIRGANGLPVYLLCIGVCAIAQIDGRGLKEGEYVNTRLYFF